jgi:hypothetical protein
VDLCIVDQSGDCVIDLCREDRGVGETCSLDAPTLGASLYRRKLARATVNKAIRWLYNLGSVAIFVGLSFGVSSAQTAIDATEALFHPTPTFATGAAVAVPSPVGPFLRDCDSDGVLEADVNGDGLCDGDPEVRDYRANGTRELPLGTDFQGSFEFSCFHISWDVAIITTGPLTVKASREVAIFGAMRLGGRTEVSSPESLDLRTSVWLSVAGEEILLSTSQGGLVGNESAWMGSEGTVPAIQYISACDATEPVIRSVSPPRVTAGSEITVKGTELGTRKGKVLLGGVKGKPLGWAPESVPTLFKKVPMPPAVYDLEVYRKDPKKSPPLVMADALEVKPPEILLVSPESGEIGDPILVTGKFFGPRKVKLTLGGKKCKVIGTTWEPLSGKSEVTFLVPKKLADGTYELTLTNKVGTATASFEVLTMELIPIE